MNSEGRKDASQDKGSGANGEDGDAGTRDERGSGTEGQRCGRARPRPRAILKSPERFRDKQSKADKRGRKTWRWGQLTRLGHLPCSHSHFSASGNEERTLTLRDVA